MPEGPIWLTGLLAAIAGAAIGSFIGTALVRLPEHRSILAGRSACDSCGAGIGARDLVPLWSWLALRGRCRACGAPIGVSCRICPRPDCEQRAYPPSDRKIAVHPLRRGVVPYEIER